VETLAERFHARKTPSGFSAKCPAHEDRVASLSIGQGQNGIVVHCHAGCEVDTVLAAAGLTTKDLFDEEPPRSKSEIVSSYDYRDERGVLLYQVCRMSPKSFRQRKPTGAGGWEWKLGDVRRVPYRLPELIAAPRARFVFVVEGEKDADRLADHGLVATCNAGGAGKWLSEYTPHFDGRNVVIVPDNDKPGRDHAEKVSEALSKAAASVRVLALPDLPEKGDVSDWFAKGGTIDAFKELVRNIDAKEKPEPEFKSATDRLREEQAERKALADRVIPFNISYLDDYCLGIYPTDLVILSAASGAGKTSLGTFMAQTAAAQGRRVFFFALEAHRNEIEQRMLFREMAQIAKERDIPHRGLTFPRWMYGLCKNFEHLEREAFLRMREKAKTMRTYYRASSFSHRDITRLFVKIREEADLIILDHLHYVDLEGPNENLELKKVTKAIRDAALGMQIPVVVVAHLRKGDRQSPRLIPSAEDIHGSSDVMKIATKIVTMAPCREGWAEQNPAMATTLMQVVKDRMRGVAGYCAIMQYDLSRLQYLEQYGVARLDNFGKELEHYYHDSIPDWGREGNGVGMRHMIEKHEAKKDAA
jgi:hypothetical protein